MRHFPSPDIGMFGRRQRHVRGTRIPVTITAGASAQASSTAIVADTFRADDVMLFGGCTCCTVRVALQRKLRDLLAERARGATHFSRVVVESRNDPAPILRTFATERVLGGEFYAEDELSTEGATHFTLTEDKPIAWDAFSRFIASLTALRGADLLHTTGLLNVEGCQGPVAVQYRQHLALQPVELQAWPDEDRHSRLEFVTRSVRTDAVQRLFDAIRNLRTSP